MSPERQEELSRLLSRVLSLDDVAALRPDASLRTIHYDWLTAGEQAQKDSGQTLRAVAPFSR